jgi:hypothetical protein
MIVMGQQQALDKATIIHRIAQDVDVKKFAGELIPRLEDRLDNARRLQSRLFSVPAARQPS